MNIGAVGNYGTETYYTGKASAGSVTNECQRPKGDTINSVKSMDRRD